MTVSVPFLGTTPCGIVGRYQHFGRVYCLHLCGWQWRWHVTSNRWQLLPCQQGFTPYKTSISTEFDCLETSEIVQVWASKLHHILNKVTHLPFVDSDGSAFRCRTGSLTRSVFSRFHILVTRKEESVTCNLNAYNSQKWFSKEEIYGRQTTFRTVQLFSSLMYINFMRVSISWGPSILALI
jgi:hypothetical protein